MSAAAALMIGVALGVLGSACVLTTIFGLMLFYDIDRRVRDLEGRE